MLNLLVLLAKYNATVSQKNIHIYFSITVTLILDMVQSLEKLPLPKVAEQSMVITPTSGQTSGINFNSV